MHFSALARIAFPPSHRGLYIAWIKIQGVAAATKFFGRDDRRARPTEGIVDPIALDRVISDRDFEQTHGFLSAVACAGFSGVRAPPIGFRFGTSQTVVLCAVTTPVARRPFLDRVPRGLVLPVILAPAHGEVLLGPYDLAPNAERCRFEACGDSACLQGGMPDVGNSPREEAPGGRPVGAVVVQDGPHGGALRRIHTMAPSWLVLNAVRRVGRHQHWPSAVKHPLNIYWWRWRPRTGAGACPVRTGRRARCS